jgi:hypothetical protein
MKRLPFKFIIMFVLVQICICLSPSAATCRVFYNNRNFRGIFEILSSPLLLRMASCRGHNNQTSIAGEDIINNNNLMLPRGTLRIIVMLEKEKVTIMRGPKLGR